MKITRRNLPARIARAKGNIERLETLNALETHGVSFQEFISNELAFWKAALIKLTN